MKMFADNTFEFAENGTKFSKQVETTMGKGEIACHEQFLCFLQCFQKTCKNQDTLKPGLFWERVKAKQVTITRHELKKTSPLALQTILI